MYAGFDVGGTNLRLALFDPTSSTPLATTKSRVRGDTAPDSVADAMVTALAELLGGLGASWSDLESVGVGLAAQLHRDGRRVANAPNLGWRDLDFVDILHTAMPQATPTLLVNDLSALVWGEHQEGGALEGVSEALAVYVGTGVGGAILSQGRLVEGVGGKAAEIGHVKVRPGGRLCGCGQRGCLEAYAGGVHLEALVAEAAQTYRIEGVLGEAGRADLGAADAMAGTHPAIAHIWDQAADMLAVSIANACTLLNPGVLLLGGGVLENCDALRTRVLERTLPLVLEAAHADLSVASPRQGALAGALGAARLAHASLE